MKLMSLDRSFERFMSRALILHSLRQIRCSIPAETKMATSFVKYQCLLSTERYVISPHQPTKGSGLVSFPRGLGRSPYRPHVLLHFELERVHLVTRNALFLMILSHMKRGIS